MRQAGGRRLSAHSDRCPSSSNAICAGVRSALSQLMRTARILRHRTAVPRVSCALSAGVTRQIGTGAIRAASAWCTRCEGPLMPRSTPGRKKGTDDVPLCREPAPYQQIQAQVRFSVPVTNRSRHPPARRQSPAGSARRPGTRTNLDERIRASAAVSVPPKDIEGDVLCA